MQVKQINNKMSRLTDESRNEIISIKKKTVKQLENKTKAVLVGIKQ